MNTRAYSCVLIQLMIGIMLVAGSGIAAGAEEPAAPTRDMREKMAAMHEKMAVCLRSDKTFAECSDAMRQECRSTMGERHCMMGMGMHDLTPPPKADEAKEPAPQ